MLHTHEVKSSGYYYALKAGLWSTQCCTITDVGQLEVDAPWAVTPAVLTAAAAAVSAVCQVRCSCSATSCTVSYCTLTRRWLQVLLQVVVYHAVHKHEGERSE